MQKSAPIPTVIAVWVSMDLYHLAEEFYDTTLNEASDAELRKIALSPWPKSEDVPEGPQRKNHVIHRSVNCQGSLMPALTYVECDI